MIPRYSRPQMAAIWEADNRFRIWFEIEAHACDAQAELGVIPKAAAKAVRERGKFEAARIDEIEKQTKHDVIAFLTNLAEHVGPEARFVHQGMTSSDVLDTCLAVQLTQASDILLDGIDGLLAALKRRALEFRDTPCMGRSHGIHAEPTTFGLKLAGYYAEWRRNRQRLGTARAEVATCALSGAVGTFANIDPYVEEYVAGKMGLAAEPVSTQVIPRDRHAAFFAALAVIAGSVERLASEIRHLQRTEVGEAGQRLSGGMRQRLTIARGLLGDPPILILDEPSSNLDRSGEAELAETLETLAQDHTVLLITYSPGLLAVCRQVLIMQKGRIVRSGRPIDVVPQLVAGQMPAPLLREQA